MHLEDENKILETRQLLALMPGGIRGSCLQPVFNFGGLGSALIPKLL
jgi:hypothetical protein